MRADIVPLTGVGLEVPEVSVLVQGDLSTDFTCVLIDAYLVDALRGSIQLIFNRLFKGLLNRVHEWMQYVVQDTLEY